MARLIVVDGPDSGAEFAVPEEKGAVLTVGRDPRNGVPLSDGSVSREHVRIEFDGREYRLVDLGSKNRTFLNGEPVRESLLRSGDRIGLGDSEVKFEDDREIEEEAGVETTIVKEISAEGGAALEGLIGALAGGAGPREGRLDEALRGVRQLLGLSRTIARSSSLDQLYRDLLGILVPALLADRGAALGLVDRRWVARAVHPGERGEAREGEAPAGAGLSESIVRRAAEEGRAVLSANTRRDERFQDKESVIGASIVSAIAAPILAPEGGEGAARGKHAVVGVLYADRRGSAPPFSEAELGLLTAAAEQAGSIARHLGEEARLRDENRNLLRSIADQGKIVGRAKAMAEVTEFIRRAAPAHQTVLIRGETGTGKELVARAIHFHGSRQGKPFAPFNCAAVPESLIESELFGHERGAFTGAVSRRKGKFELADGGTVFLDEVAELSPSCQAKLLRLLEDRRFERLGGAQTVEVDVRVIAATNRDLSRAIAEGKFREDLFYRLNVLGVTLPPLRERREDIPLLVEHFLREQGAARRALAPDAEEKLLAYSWPGNVRQLKNVIESAVVLGDGPAIRAADLTLPAASGVAAGGGGWEPLTLEELERRHIQRMLEHTGGNKKRAAEILGIERCTLYAKLKSMAPPQGGGGEE